VAFLNDEAVVSDRGERERERAENELLYVGLNTLLEGFHTTEATARCTFAYSAGPGTEPILFEGDTHGRIVPARGPNEFGWDPVRVVIFLLHFFSFFGVDPAY
jgi:inosine/xanthosine triphosphate pyrophosphatase family protein